MQETRAIDRTQHAVGHCRAVVIEGPDKGRSCRIQRAILIGTADHCDLQLTDETISRRHVTVEPTADGVRLRDERSKNGIFVDELRVRDVEVPISTRIRLGQTLIRIDPERFAEPGIEAKEMPGSFGRFLGKSPVLASMYERIGRAAASDVTVLLEGESGTGKEVLAEAIHEASPRKNGPFIVVDCGSIPETLIEAELFGHEAGAFTGAVESKPGAFEAANGGTIFLDEIGELPLAMQTRLLRALDRKQVRRLGGNSFYEVDVRVIAATNRDLDHEVEEGRFRLDLFHRIAIALIRVPALRERPEDIEYLAFTFLERLKKPSETLTREALSRMAQYAWPGNVRELRNYIERLAVMGESTEGLDTTNTEIELTPVDLARLSYREARAKVLENFTRNYLAEVLKNCGGNVSKAARTAGIARRYFYRLRQGVMDAD
ncbi:MAG: sigma 54-dependent Fis family transcriptional regulator [Myxococcota bacterium]